MIKMTLFRQTAVGLALMGSTIGLSYSQEAKNPLPGYFVDYVHKVQLGEGFKSCTPLSLGYTYCEDIRDVLQKNESHIAKGIGKPKNTVHEALPLGHLGWIIVGYTASVNDPRNVKCFKNKLGSDFYVHEPLGANRREKFQVFVNPNKDSSIDEWYSLGIKETKLLRYGTIADTILSARGYTPFDLDDAVDKEGNKKELTHAYWIKVVDMNSRATVNGVNDGFDLSTVKLEEICLEVSRYEDKRYFMRIPMLAFFDR